MSGRVRCGHTQDLRTLERKRCVAKVQKKSRSLE